MCKEDVRIMRQTKVNYIDVDVIGATMIPVLPANPDRYALSLWTFSAGDLSVSWRVVAVAGRTNVSPAVLGISYARPVDRATLNDLGVMITDQIQLWGVLTGSVRATIAETVFLKSLGDL